MTPPLVIAHRGASRDAPENTLAAVHLAWKQGADAIETDLRLASDGRIVAFHDADGRRLLGDLRPLRDIPVVELRGRVPRLTEVLATLPAGKHAVLELKEPLVPALKRELTAAPLDRITLIAFDPELIAQAKRELPACLALWLFGDYASLARGRGEWLARRVRELGVDGVDLRHERRLDARLLAPLRADGRTVFTYTVNHARSVVRAALLGVDGLTTDRPADVRRWLGIST